jgi:hypothetical protein
MSATTATVQRPNPAILGQFDQILRFDELKQLFKPLDKTHDQKTEWSKAFGAGTLALGILSALAFKQAYKYAAAGLAVAAVAAVTQIRKTVNVPTKEYTAKCQAINDLFKDVAAELRMTWQVASNLIAGAVTANAAAYRNAEAANADTARFVDAFLNAESWWIGTDPFRAATEEQRPWRNVFKDLLPKAQQLAGVELAKVEGLHPVVAKGLTEVQAESVRLVRGNFPAAPGMAYVENKVAGEGSDAKLVSQPWQAPTLKV